MLFRSEFEQRMHGVGEDIREATHSPHPRAGLWFGGALIILGIILFVERLHIAWLAWLNTGLIWPLLVIAVGIAFLYRGFKKG